METHQSTNPHFNAALFGFGYWGPNLARNLSRNQHFTLKHICDHAPDRLDSARNQYPLTNCTSNAEEALSDPEVDLVCLATPASTHHALGIKAITEGKHVLIEKPLALDSAAGAELVTQARQKGVMLAVDHTFVFTGAVRKLRDLALGGELGRLLFFDSIRVNLGLVQPDVNVLWDLAVHDLAILQHVTEKLPIAVSATGKAHSPSTHPSTAYMTLFYEDDFIAHVGTSWMSPVKVRRSLLSGTQKMAVYDDLDSSQQIKVYDSSLEETPGNNPSHMRQAEPRIGDMVAPKIDRREALSVEIDHLAACLRGEVEPLVPGERGLEIIKILEAATQSLGEDGTPIEIVYITP